jgi:hypothetical protein
MNETLQIVLLTVAGLILLRFLVILILSGGNFSRIMLTIRASFRLLRDAELAAKVQKLLTPPPPGPVKPSGETVRLFALLQREGRLLDFLLEDIQAYSNDQVGAAVRDIHKNCQHALKEHLVLEPVMPQAEGASVQVPGGFDPSAIRLTGNVSGEPPFRGILQHHGWRVKELKLAAPPEGQDELVLQPAEVDLP